MRKHIVCNGIFFLVHMFTFASRAVVIRDRLKIERSTLNIIEGFETV